MALAPVRKRETLSRVYVYGGTRIFALAPVRERNRRFRLYKEAPGFRPGPRERERETLPRV